jgi:glutaminase
VNYQRILDDVAADVVPFIGKGNLARYIPPLTKVDPNQFGMALFLLDGRLFTVGDANVRFSIQSISKVFSLALASARVGDELWSRVGREPSGAPYNSLIQLEEERGKPRNPFINAGALVVVDVLSSHCPRSEEVVVELLRRLAQVDDIEIDVALAEAAREVSHRNFAIAHLLKDFGNLRNSVDNVIRNYCYQCSITMSCSELAAAAAFLAAGGIATNGGERILDSGQAKRVNALMAGCGTYDGAGDFAYRVGLPAKSGVGGGVLVVIPGLGTACAWSPTLDASGNSSAGVAALERFVKITGLSIY